MALFQEIGWLRHRRIFIRLLPGYKSIKNILDTGSDQMEMPDKKSAASTNTEPEKNSHALTRGADYYRR